MSELLIVGSEQDNTRLDRFLADQYEDRVLFCKS